LAVLRDRIRSALKASLTSPFVVVLLLAAILRVAHVLALRPLPLFKRLMIDSEFYDQWAQGIAGGDWIGGAGAFFMDPLYPYFLGLLYRLFGHDLLMARLWQAALGVATCGLVGLMGRQLGGKAIGTAAALLVALYQPLVFEGGEIEKTALGVFLITASLLLAMQKPVLSKGGAGACLALAALARSNLLVMAPLGAVWFLLVPEDAPSSPRTPGFVDRWRERITGPPGRSAGAFILGWLLVLLPVLWRNHHVSGEWVLTTSQAGANFYLGNNPSNDTGSFAPLPFVRALPRYQDGDFRARAEAVAGRSLTPGEVSSFWFREALTHLREHPGFAAKVFFRKFTLFWGDFEVPDGWSMYFIRQYSPALRLAFLTFGWLLPLAVLGLMASFRGNRQVHLLVAFVATYNLSLVAFYVHSRYRVYVVPPLAVLAAFGLKWLWDHARRRAWREAVPGLVTASCAGLFSFAGVRFFTGFGPEGFVQNYAHLASFYEDKRDFKSAEALLTEGFRRNPQAASVLCGLGSLYLRTDVPQQAQAWFARCLVVDQYYLNAWFQMGQTHEALGNLEMAKACYRKQLELQPGHQFAAICLQNLSARGGAFQHPTPTGGTSPPPR